mgnify:CR=1 FL=1
MEEFFIENSNFGGKVSLRCKKFVDNAQQCFTPQANFEISLKMKEMGYNPGYLKSFLLC